LRTGGSGAVLLAVVPVVLCRYILRLSHKLHIVASFAIMTL
jgi:hypothetical protein